MINSFMKLRLKDKTVNLTLTFERINYLRSYYNEFYLDLMKILSSKNLDIVDVIETIYISYLCANDDEFSLDEFLAEIDDAYSIVDRAELIELYVNLITIKKNDGFREPFELRTKKKRKASIPNFELQDIEDYYSYYVLILNISEEVFWKADYSFVNSVIKNKISYDNYINSEKEKEMEKSKRRK